MNDIPALALACFGGFLLGAAFFAGLWWTIQKGVASERPAFWFLGSLILRIGLIVAGFSLVSQGQWLRLGVCFLGFLIARVVVVRRLTRDRTEEPTPSGKEASHATESR